MRYERNATLGSTSKDSADELKAASKLGHVLLLKAEMNEAFSLLYRCLKRLLEDSVNLSSDKILRSNISHNNLLTGLCLLGNSFTNMFLRESVHLC